MQVSGAAAKQGRDKGLRHRTLAPAPRGPQAPVPCAPNSGRSGVSEPPIAALPGTARNHPSPLMGGITLGLRSISNCCLHLPPNATGIRMSQSQPCRLREPWQGLSLPQPEPRFPTYTLTSSACRALCQGPPASPPPGAFGGSLAPVSPKKNTQPGQTGVRYGRASTGHRGRIGAPSPLAPRSPVHAKDEPNSRTSYPHAPWLWRPIPCPPPQSRSALLVLAAKSGWQPEHRQQA